MVSGQGRGLGVEVSDEKTANSLASYPSDGSVRMPLRNKLPNDLLILWLLLSIKIIITTSYCGYIIVIY